MHTRLIYRGDDLVNGFNSDIDPAALDHKVIQKSNRFYIGSSRMSQADSAGYAPSRIRRLPASLRGE